MRKPLPLFVMTLTLAAAVPLLAGCERQANTPPPQNAATIAALPADLFLKAPPAEPKDVAALRTTAHTGDAVVMRARIGGRVEPFVPGRAMFLVADTTLLTCKDRHGDHGCPTPWDYCCEPKDNLAASTATVQIVDADGRPLKLDVQGMGGLNPMASIIVAGKVSSAAEGVLVVDAGGIFIEQ